MFQSQACEPSRHLLTTAGTPALMLYLSDSAGGLNRLCDLLEFTSELWVDAIFEEKLVNFQKRGILVFENCALVLLFGAIFELFK